MASTLTVTVVPLSDNDPMPFGHFRGAKMKDVPASYLDRLRDADYLPDYPRLEAYIELNARAIDKELEEEDRRRERRY